MSAFLGNVLFLWSVFVVTPSVAWDWHTYRDRLAKWERERAAADRRG